jgi:hypothetical protein
MAPRLPNAEPVLTEHMSEGPSYSVVVVALGLQCAGHAERVGQLFAGKRRKDCTK